MVSLTSFCQIKGNTSSQKRATQCMSDCKLFVVDPICKKKSRIPSISQHAGYVSRKICSQYGLYLEFIFYYNKYSCDLICKRDHFCQNIYYMICEKTLVKHLKNSLVCVLYMYNSFICMQNCF